MYSPLNIIDINTLKIPLCLDHEYFSEGFHKYVIKPEVQIYARLAAYHTFVSYL